MLSLPLPVSSFPAPSLSLFGPPSPTGIETKASFELAKLNSFPYLSRIFQHVLSGGHLNLTQCFVAHLHRPKFSLQFSVPFQFLTAGSSGLQPQPAAAHAAAGPAASPARARRARRVHSARAAPRRPPPPPGRQSDRLSKKCSNISHRSMSNISHRNISQQHFS